MAVYKDLAAVKELFVELWTELIEKTEFGPKMRKGNLSILYEVKDPDFFMYVDGHGTKFGDEAKNQDAVIKFYLSGDIAHKFWLKKLNVSKALVTRQIRSRGPVPKVMKLLPLIKPGYEMYRKYCEKYNLPTDI